MSNTASPNPRSKRNRKRLLPVISTLCLILAGLAAASFLLDKPRSYYPEVTMQVGNDLRMGFLHQPHAEVTACEMAVNKVVTAMKNACPDCTIVDQRCLQKLSPRQKLLLDDANVDVPVMRLPSAVISFEATDPAIAQQTCNASAIQSGENNTCASPDTAKLAVVLAETSHQQMQPNLSPATLAKLTAFAALTSFLICALIIWSECWHARFSHDAVDSGPQKFHSTPVPRVGGLAIACAIGAVITVMDYVDLFQVKTEQGFALLALAAMPAFAGGLLEDITKKVGVLARLLLTMSAGVVASLLVGATLDRLDIFGLDSLLQRWPLLAIAFTAFSVAGLANAINIIDGYNGLASGFSIPALLAFAFAALQLGDNVVLIASLSMLGAVTGFIVWNWPSGRIFLGDGGAYLLGFWLAEIAILIVVRNPIISPWFALLVLAYPIWETLYSMYRRKVIQQKNTGDPDAHHMHQLIYQRIKEKSGNQFNVKQEKLLNSRVAPFIWITSAGFTAAAVIVRHNTAHLVILAIVSLCCYIFSYRRLDSSSGSSGRKKSEQ